MRYLAHLSTGRTILWCYLAWYLFFVQRYFDPSLNIWLSSLGISAIIGIALFISTAGGQARLNRWQIFRLFLMPFCVSSFSALIKGCGFLLIFSPVPAENLIALGLCASLWALVAAVKFGAGKSVAAARQPSISPSHPTRH